MKISAFGDSGRVRECERCLLSCVGEPLYSHLLLLPIPTTRDGVYINGKRDYIDERFVKTFHDAGYVFAVWTIDNADDAAYFVKAGVDAITSNCAAAMCKAVAV